MIQVWEERIHQLVPRVILLIIIFIFSISISLLLVFYFLMLYFPFIILFPSSLSLPKIIIFHSSLGLAFNINIISFWILLSYLILIKELILGDIILALLSFSWYLYFHFPFYHSLSLREQLFYCLLSWSNRILNNKWFSIVSLIINNVIFFFWGYRSGKGQGKE